MSWLERIRPHPPAPPRHRGREEAPPERVERASPGLGALFGALREGGGHSVLDLGTAGDQHLQIFGRFARWIRFAGLLPDPPREEALATALAAIRPNEPPYDVVLAWDVFDRLGPADRKAVMARLVELTAPGARLYAVVDASGAATSQPVRCTLTALDRVVQEPVGSPEPAPDPLLPAQVERLLAPFEVAHAFTLKSRLREYVVVRR